MNHSQEEGQRWLAQARYDLEAAELKAREGFAALACFTRTALQAAIGLLILAFWAQALVRNWDRFAATSWHIAWPSLALALAVLLVQMLLLATIWWRALALTGVLIPWRRGIALWLQAQIARYLPGGVWDIAGRLALGQRVGVSRRAMSASVGLEMGLQVLSAALILVLSLLFWPGTATAYLPLAVLVAAIALVTLTPPVFTRLVNRGLRLLGRPPLNLRLTYPDLMALFLARVLAHLLLGLGFVLFAQGLTPVPWSLAPLLAGAYVGAWLAGYLAVVAPTGIGVREGVLVLLLGGHLPFAAATAAALGYRAWIGLRDLLAALLGVWLARKGTTGRATGRHDHPRQVPLRGLSDDQTGGRLDVAPTPAKSPSGDPPPTNTSRRSAASHSLLRFLTAGQLPTAGQPPTTQSPQGDFANVAAVSNRRSVSNHRPSTSVLFLTTNYARDEGDYHSPWLRSLIRHLSARGIDVTVLAPSFRGLEDHRVDGVPVRRFRYAPARWETLTHESGAPNKLRANPLYWTLVLPYLLAGTLATVRELRRRADERSATPYDVIHVHWPVPQALFAQVARWRTPARLVLTFYGADVALARRFPLLRWAVRRWVRVADAVTAISTHTARALADLTGVQPRVIPFGVDIPPRQGIEPPLRGTHHILAVGRLIERKGYPVLIRAMAHVREQVPDARLTIVGEGHERGRLEGLIRQLGLEGTVRLAGRVSDGELDALYRWADLLVLPSLVDRGGDTEGLGMVLLEALSYGRPVVASAVGGITDIVQDGETGLLVPPGDPHALAQAILRLFQDPAWARELAEQGWTTNRERFDWERVADAYAALYRQSAA